MRPDIESFRSSLEEAHGASHGGDREGGYFGEIPPIEPTAGMWGVPPEVVGG